MDVAMLAKKSPPQPPADVQQIEREMPLPSTAKLLDHEAGVIRHMKYELTGYDERGDEQYQLTLDSSIAPIEINDSGAYS
ncbi:MAG: hypothetical protein ACPG80_00140 [Rickettsiales bacterium]